MAWFRLLFAASVVRAALALLPACHELGGAPQLSPRSRASLVTSLFELAAQRVAEAPRSGDASPYCSFASAARCLRLTFWVETP